jgi:hypothetical protein
MIDNVFITIGVSLVTGLIGLLVGNRMAIGRDKRKEFNAIAEPIRIILLQEREKLSSCSAIPNKVDLVLFRERLPFWKRGAFDRALQNYQKSKSEENLVRDQYGSVFYKNRPLVIHNIDSLLKITKIR